MVLKEKTRKKKEKPIDQVEQDPWERTQKTGSGKQRMVHTTIDETLFRRMQKISPMLIEMEKRVEGGGIKRNNPSATMRYLLENGTKGIEEVIKEIMERNARS